MPPPTAPRPHRAPSPCLLPLRSGPCYRGPCYRGPWYRGPCAMWWGKYAFYIREAVFIGWWASLLSLMIPHISLLAHQNVSDRRFQIDLHTFRTYNVWKYVINAASVQQGSFLGVTWPSASSPKGGAVTVDPLLDLYIYIIYTIGGVLMCFQGPFFRAPSPSRFFSLAGGAGGR